MTGSSFGRKEPGFRIPASILLLREVRSGTQRQELKPSLWRNAASALTGLFRLLFNTTQGHLLRGGTALSPAGDVTQQLRALATLWKPYVWFSALTWWLTTLCNSDSSSLTSSFDLHRHQVASGVDVFVQAVTQTQEIR